MPIVPVECPCVQTKPLDDHVTWLGHLNVKMKFWLHHLTRNVNMAFNQPSIDIVIIVLVSILCYFGKNLTNFVSFIPDGGVWSKCFLICWFLVKLKMDGSLGNFFGFSLKMIPIQILVHFLSFQQSSTCKLVHFTLPVSWENGNQSSLDIISNNWKWKFQTRFICISHIKMEVREFVKFIYDSIDKNTLKNGRKFSKIFTCNRYSSWQMGSPNKKQKKGNNSTTTHWTL